MEDSPGFGFAIVGGFAVVGGFAWVSDQRTRKHRMELECETLDFQLQLDSELLDFKQQNRV